MAKAQNAIGAVAVDADVKPEPDQFKDQELIESGLGGPASVPFGQGLEDGMLVAAAKMLEERAAQHGFYTWRIGRAKMMLLALDEGRGDIDRSLAHLEKEIANRLSSDADEVENAYRYPQGLRAYPGFEERQEKEPPTPSRLIPPAWAGRSEIGLDYHTPLWYHWAQGDDHAQR